MKNPYSKKHYHRAQAEYFDKAHAAIKKGKKAGVQKLTFQGGRGSGKTAVGIADLVEVAMANPGMRTFWSEPTYSDIDRIFLTAMEDIVPKVLWEHKSKKGGHEYIEWINGHRTELISRYINNSKKKPGLGGNVMGGWFDEAAIGFDKNKFDDISNSIRQPKAPYYFVRALTTPLENDYIDWRESPGAEVVFATSWDNPHLIKEVIDSRAADMAPEDVQRELYGKIVKSEGLIWKHFKEEQFPDGNLFINTGFNPLEPYYLSFDLGAAQGAAQAYQLANNGNTLVLVEEWCTNDLGFEDLVPQMMKDLFTDNGFPEKTPVEVWIGHDVNARDKLTGSTAARWLNNKGWKWRYPGGPLSSKEIQRSHLSTLLYKRKIAFGVKMGNRNRYELYKSHYLAGKSRGVMNVLRRDEYPKNSNEVFSKDKTKKGRNALEDDRDAMLYAGICWLHPTILQKEYFK